MKTAKKYSKKRETILQIIRNTDTHPSAEWIYNQVKTIHPDLSLGTVYRNLTLFEENGDITTVGNVNGQKRYDATTKPHTHFICECCGCVRDIKVEQASKDLYYQINEDYGFETAHHSLTFFGKCEECKNLQII